MGPHNIYNIYDNCGATQRFLQRTGKTMGWLLGTVRQGLADPARTHRMLVEMNGGCARGARIPRSGAPAQRRGMSESRAPASGLPMTCQDTRRIPMQVGFA